MNMREHDDDFDLRLSKRERLLPQFDAELDGPDADTDRLLIARARSASHPVQLRSPASKTFRAPRWAVPVGLAATLVLSFTLLLHTNPPSVSAPTPAVTDTVTPPPAQQIAPPVAASERALRDGTMRNESASVGEAAKTMPPAPPPPPATSAAATADVAAPTAAPAPTVAPAPASALRRGESGLPAEDPADAERASAGAVAAAQSMADAAMEQAAGAPLGPETWLGRIERLRSGGADAEARRELLAFRQQYPDHPLPAELQALLPAP